jgi:hypothetical protein
MLRLPAGAPMVDDHDPRRLARGLAAEIALDQAKRHVDSRRHPGRGPDGAVDDEDPVDLDAGVRIARLQRLSEHPVRGRTPAVEQAGLSQDERPDADRGDAPIAGRPLLQDREKIRRRWVRVGRRADQDRVELDVGNGLRFDRHAKGVGQMPATRRDEMHVIMGFAEDHVRGFEDGERREAERRETGRQQQANIGNVRLPIAPAGPGKDEA